MTELRLSLHEGQQQVWNSSARFKVVAAGRRWGKTTYARMAQLFHALQDPIHPDAETWYIAPTYGLAKSIYWGPLKRLAEPVTSKVWETEGKILLTNGRYITLKGADEPDRLRGNALDFVVFDEYAQMKPSTWDEVVRPALADTRGSALFIGTPEGKNHFFDLAMEAQVAEDWEFFSFTTAENPAIDHHEIEQARKDMSSDSFRQEFEASFFAGAGTVFKHLDPIIEEGVHPDGLTFIAVDLAGFGTDKGHSKFRKLDETAIAVVTVDPLGWHVQDIIHGRWDIRETATRILLAAREYKPVGIGIEQGSLYNAVSPYLYEHAARLGVFQSFVPIRHTGRDINKATRITWALQARLEKRTLRFRDGEYLKVLLDQLADFPNGAHDDLIDALAMIEFMTTHFVGGGSRVSDTWEPEDAAVGY